jgi:hypothetical protein
MAPGITFALEQQTGPEEIPTYSVEGNIFEETDDKF